MAKIGFLGLGFMGTPMASRLLDAGNDVTVWNRSPDKMQPLVARGASPSSSPAEATLGADVVVTMLTDAQALEAVLFGDDGVASALHAGQVLVDMSTVGPDAIGEIAARLPLGVDLVDAPVRGSVPEATEGRLSIFAGATDDAFSRVSDLLGTMGTVRHVGPPGSGAAMKLVVNSTLGAAISGVGEALALGNVLGLDRALLFDVLEETPLGGTAKGKRSNIESGTYPANFKLGLALKDLGLVTAAAAQRGRDLKVASAARAWFEQAVDAGVGDLDYSAVIETILER
jgi:3-hydroxyisobutyrate dehydrogenase-like beta-hydroxyacid dehydrogenase